ncbi:hypothetical protein CNECB9_380026 [Cupriavidus necator]|uniref:Uncharacterized protein n=1 Tax=Cupriavidus necator TaxID=106590 RepID=A0A1K0JQQ0_CUPNE|nr:hypothetical protein CNECB9_380026 [Cupriavidus necator]
MAAPAFLAHQHRPVRIRKGFWFKGCAAGWTHYIVLCKVAQMKSADLIRQLASDGWYLTNVVGSHHQFKHRPSPAR